MGEFLSPLLEIGGLLLSPAPPAGLDGREVDDGVGAPFTDAATPGPDFGAIDKDDLCVAFEVEDPSTSFFVVVPSNVLRTLS